MDVTYRFQGSMLSGTQVAAPYNLLLHFRREIVKDRTLLSQRERTKIANCVSASASVFAEATPRQVHRVININKVTCRAEAS